MTLKTSLISNLKQYKKEYSKKIEKQQNKLVIIYYNKYSELINQYLR